MTNNPMATILVDTMQANESPKEKCWRLVHDNAKVISLFEGEGFTWTIFPLFCSETEKECLDEIARLHLEYKPDEDLPK